MAELKAEMEGRPKPRAPLRVSDELPPKAEFVAGMTAEFGGAPDRWAADYDRMAEEVRAGEPREGDPAALEVKTKSQVIADAKAGNPWVPKR
jgi:hypothetical protein